MLAVQLQRLRLALSVLTASSHTTLSRHTACGLRLPICWPIGAKDEEPVVPSSGFLIPFSNGCGRHLVLSDLGAEPGKPVGIVVASFVEVAGATGLHISIARVPFALHDLDAVAPDVLSKVPQPEPEIGCWPG